MTQYTYHAQTILALSEGPATAPKLGEKIGIHADCVRELLDVLAKENLAECIQRGTGPGHAKVWRLK